jgi:DNA-binding transcriptional regulator/RsmH inhibitor MraZ
MAEEAGGRPPKWRLEPPSPVVRELLGVEEDGPTTGRISLPKSFSEIAGGPGARVLVVCPEAGRIELRAWDPDGARVEARRSALVSQGPPYEELVLEALRQFEDRYLSRTIEKDGRLRLPQPAMVHLGIAAGVLLVALRYPSRLELWSLAYRNERLSRRAAVRHVAEELSDLP